jgi:hypothetical protein
MIVVIAMKSHIEFLEAEAMLLFRVTLGLFDLSDHSVIHTLSPFQIEILLLEMKPCFQAAVFEFQTYHWPVWFCNAW